ncbi:kinase-like domain-containing protein [Mycena epipterygia]|nr:kinase-like domain-containing protein [Mycena epipterygia]
MAFVNTKEYAYELLYNHDPLQGMQSLAAGLLDDFSWENQLRTQDEIGMYNNASTTALVDSPLNHITITTAPPRIPKNFVLYVLSILNQRSDRRLNEFRGLIKQWEAWDVLTSLTNYRSVVEMLFSFLKDTDSFGNTHAIAKGIFNAMSQDIETIFDRLTFILRDSVSRATCKTMFTCRGDPAQQLLDITQELLDLFPNSTSRPLLCKALLQLSRTSGLHPTCFALSGLQKLGQQVAGGGFGDIWKGLLRGQSVSVKVMRLFGEANIKAALKEFGHEALIWRQFSHPNLLPFYGLYYVENRLCLVSPWMSNGHVMEFLKKATPYTKRVSLILDVALGLEYLHRECVVHGDLKGMNILVTPSGRAWLPISDYRPLWMPLPSNLPTPPQRHAGPHRDIKHLN